MLLTTPSLPSPPFGGACMNHDAPSSLIFVCFNKWESISSLKKYKEKGIRIFLFRSVLLLHFSYVK